MHHITRRVLTLALLGCTAATALAQSDQRVVADSAAEATARLTQDTQRWGQVARRIQLRLE